MQTVHDSGKKESADPMEMSQKHYCQFIFTYPKEIRPFLSSEVMSLASMVCVTVLRRNTAASTG